jgi:predicted transcriptional regulator
MTTSGERVIIGTWAALRPPTNLQVRSSSLQILSQTLRGGTVKTVTLDVATRRDAGEDFVRAWETGKSAKNARISFETPELLWKVLTARRWELLKSLCGVGPVSIREAARRLGRDVKTVHGDVTALLDAGVLDRTASGAIEFPYEAVKVEFLLQAA